MIVICGRCSTRSVASLGGHLVQCWRCRAVCQVEYPHINRRTTRDSEGGVSGAPRNFLRGESPCPDNGNERISQDPPSRNFGSAALNFTARRTRFLRLFKVRRNATSPLRNSRLRTSGNNQTSEVTSLQEGLVQTQPPTDAERNANSTREPESSSQNETNEATTTTQNYGAERMRRRRQRPGRVKDQISLTFRRVLWRKPVS